MGSSTKSWNGSPRGGLLIQYPYLILDARYEKVREDGVIAPQAVMIAIGVDWEGRRNVLAVELAHRESLSSWKEFCLALKERGLHGVELVISDDHAGLRKAIGCGPTKDIRLPRPSIPHSGDGSVRTTVLALGGWRKTAGRVQHVGRGRESDQ